MLNENDKPFKGVIVTPPNFPKKTETQKTPQTKLPKRKTYLYVGIIIGLIIGIVVGAIVLNSILDNYPRPATKTAITVLFSGEHMKVPKGTVIIGLAYEAEDGGESEGIHKKQNETLGSPYVTTKNMLVIANTKCVLFKDKLHIEGTFSPTADQEELLETIFGEDYIIYRFKQLKP